MEAGGGEVEGGGVEVGGGEVESGGVEAGGGEVEGGGVEGVVAAAAASSARCGKGLILIHSSSRTL